MKRLCLFLFVACGGDDGGSVTGDCASLMAEIAAEDALPCTIPTAGIFVDQTGCPLVVTDAQTSVMCTTVAGGAATLDRSQYRDGKRGALVTDGAGACEFRACQ